MVTPSPRYYRSDLNFSKHKTKYSLKYYTALWIITCVWHCYSAISYFFKKHSYFQEASSFRMTFLNFFTLDKCFMNYLVKTQGHKNTPLEIVSPHCRALCDVEIMLPLLLGSFLFCKAVPGYFKEVFYWTVFLGCAQLRAAW